MNRDLDYLEFLLECIDHLEKYTDNIDEDTFLRDEEKKDACLTRIVMIGEYSSRISENIKDKFTNVEWQLMKSTRNFLFQPASPESQTSSIFYSYHQFLQLNQHH